MKRKLVYLPTYYSKDKNEINELIKDELSKGFRKVEF